VVDFGRQEAQGIFPASIFSLFTRRFSMKKIMLSVIAVMCVIGFSSLSFSADMGEMKDKMKGEMKEMKEKMGEMKGDMKGDKAGEMKGEMKGDKMGDMKGKIKEKMGEMKEKMGK
jgi:hypothetical protein